MEVGARDKDGILGAGQDDTLEFRRVGNEIQVVAQLVKRFAVKNVRRGIGTVERENANLLSGDLSIDTGETVLLRHGWKRRSAGRWDDSELHPFFIRGQSFGPHKASSQSAAPCPPPTQREISARFAFRRFNSFKLVKTSRAPVAPTG